MIRVSVKDLEGQKILEYDLYTQNDKLVCKKGTPLTPGKILQFSYIKLYKKEDQPQSPIPETEVNQKESEIIKVEIPVKDNSAIDPTVRKTILTSTRSFLNDIEKGATPDVAICELASEMLVDEVASKIDDVKYLGELRVFDEYTYSHNVNVSALSVALGLKLGLKDENIRDLALGTMLHDIGKMRIPKQVLNKPGKLTDKEFELIKLHSALGFKIISDELNLPFKISRIALEHQERYGGGGYPRNLMGDDIGYFSQICAIADVYDALISKRVYKAAKTSPEALKIMLSEGSRSFNPGLLYKFAHMANYSTETK